MLTQFLAEAIALVVDTIVAGIEGLVPPDFYNWLSTFVSQLGYLLSFGPASAIGVLFMATWAIDMAFNVMAFTVQTYKLIPAKAT